MGKLDNSKGSIFSKIRKTQTSISRQAPRIQKQQRQAINQARPSIFEQSKTDKNQIEYIPKDVVDTGAKTPRPGESSPLPTPSISATPSVTPSNTPSISVTPSVTPSITPSNTPSNTPAISATPSVTPSTTPSTTPSNTPSISVTPSVTPSTLPPPDAPNDKFRVRVLDSSASPDEVVYEFGFNNAGGLGQTGVQKSEYDSYTDYLIQTNTVTMALRRLGTGNTTPYGGSITIVPNSNYTSITSPTGKSLNYTYSVNDVIDGSSDWEWTFTGVDGGDFACDIIVNEGDV